ncbi:hypothetical protein KUTeg_018345 [Tegillarca granosa]|uniref:Uncharacterized protein n=1 Tax=Tegillarca granosa TaxID=220873 RepID=A0ABQ9EHL4_TEGGR|nr:hypothetical protein KUTeg_018345 [Tegillarca granosa]
MKTSGSVYTWGSGSEGQLGFGEKIFFSQLISPSELIHLLSCIDGDSGISDLEQEQIISTVPPTTTLLLRSAKMNEQILHKRSGIQNGSDEL